MHSVIQQGNFIAFCPSPHAHMLCLFYKINKSINIFLFKVFENNRNLFYVVFNSNYNDSENFKVNGSCINSFVMSF